jgi:hypothetical protein
MLLGSLFVHDAPSFGWAFIGHTVLSGTYFTCSASLGQQLYPRAKFSQYASAGGILGSLTGLAFAPSLGAILDLSNNDYHLTFWFGLGLALLTLCLMGIVYRNFLKYGGTRSYLAPGDTGDARSRPEPPANMIQILTPYFVGAIIGIGGGYVLAYIMNSGVVVILAALGWQDQLLTYIMRHHIALGTGFAQFHLLLTQDAQVRNLATFCVATGVIPGALLGSMVGNKWANRKQRPA